MNLIKSFSAIIVGTIFTWFCLAMVMYQAGKTAPPSSGNYLTLQMTLQFAMIISAIYCLPIGVITSTIIVGLELNLIKAVVLGLGFGLLLSLIILIFSNFTLDMRMASITIALITIEILNAAIVSLISYSNTPIE